MARNIPETRIKGGTVIGFIEEKKPAPKDEPKPAKDAKK